MNPDIDIKVEIELDIDIDVETGKFFLRKQEIDRANLDTSGDGGGIGRVTSGAARRSCAPPPK